MYLVLAIYSGDVVCVCSCNYQRCIETITHYVTRFVSTKQITLIMQRKFLFKWQTENAAESGSTIDDYYLVYYWSIKLPTSLS